MKFRSQTEHILPINLFSSSFTFFLPALMIQISRASRSVAAAPHSQENSNRLNTFSTSQSVVFVMVRIVFEFNSYIFSDLFPLFNMLATAITNEPSRKLENEYRTKRIMKQKKKSDFISTLKCKSKPIDFRPMKLPDWSF